MELLVRPVLLRMAGQNAFGTNPQLQPPDGELGQPRQARARKRGPIVTADPQRQPILRKRPG